MEAKKLPIKEVKCIHVGQYRPYGDSFYVYEIILEDNAEVSEEDILAYCFAEISKRKVQSKAEWSANYDDANSYFSGYYELVQTPQGYRYTKCSPYTD